MKLIGVMGNSGTGKTTIVDELAYKIQKDEVPNFLKNQKIILSKNMEKNIIKELKKLQRAKTFKMPMKQ